MTTADAGGTMPDRDDGLSFVVFSDDWGAHPSSCQHLFRRISARYPVLWVNTVGMRNPTLTWTDLSKAWKKITRMLAGGQTANGRDGGVHVCQPAMLPFSGYGMVRRFNRFTVTSVLRGALRRRGLSEPVVVTTVPNASDLVGGFSSGLVVYYCVDDFAEWPGLNKSAVQRMEREIISMADVFIAASDTTYRKLAQSGKPTFLLPHGVDLEMFSSDAPSEHPVLRHIPEPRVGYFGLFDERSDQSLVADLAARLGECSFVIAGPVVVDVSRLKKLPNVFFTGPVEYRELPALAKGIDVFLIPYSCNLLSESLSPLKLKEYLATGKPVVSTPLAGIRAYGDLVYTGSTADELAYGIRGCLSHPSHQRAARVRAILQGEDWHAKASQFVDICINHKEKSGKQGDMDHHSAGYRPPHHG